MILGGGLAYMKDSNAHYALKAGVDEAVVHLDWSSAAFVQPACLVMGAALLELAAETGRPVRIDVPSQRDPAVYVSRMGLGRVAASVGFEDPFPVVTSHPAEHRFIELSRCGDFGTTDDLCDMIADRLEDWNDDALLRLLYDNLFEMTLNVEEHAQAGGYVAAQWYEGTQCLHLAIGDWGRGVKASLLEAGHSFASDAAAVRAACTSRISRKGDDFGAGLPSTIRSITERKGSVRIYSGSTMLVFGPDGSFYSTLLSESWPGTLVSVQLPYVFR